MTPEPGFTMKELLQEIADIDVYVDLGERLTTRDFMRILGLGSMKTTRRRIKPLVDKGVLVATRISIKNMAGFNSTVPAYAINPEATWEDVRDIIDGGYNGVP